MFSPLLALRLLFGGWATGIDTFQIIDHIEHTDQSNFHGRYGDFSISDVC